MKFRSPTDEPVSVGLTSGHTELVPPEGKEIAQMFHREAIALGCIPGSIEDQPAKNDTPQFDRAEVIGTALEAMKASSDPSSFTAGGMPNLNVLSGKVGFKVAREEADLIWAAIKEDAGE